MNGLLRRLLCTADLAREAIGQSRFAFASLENIAAAQRRRLRSALRHAHDVNPFYREQLDRLRIEPARAELSDLARLPLVERSALSPDREHLRDLSHPGALRLESSGTTGRRVIVDHDLSGLIRGTAYGIRERSVLWPRLGRRVPRRELLIVANPSSGEMTRQRCQDNLLSPPGAVPERRVLFFDTPPGDALPTITAFRPDLLVTYGSYLAGLLMALEIQPEMRLPPLVVFYGDSLNPVVRARLQDRGVTCFSRYKAVEGLHLGFECERHTGLHMNVDLYPLRVVDRAGDDVAPGTPGELVFSNLVNRATLIFNYRLGDRVTRLEDPCPCGRRLPLFALSEGRLDDMVLRPDGAPVHYQEIHRWFYNAPVIEYRIEQSTLRAFTLDIVALPHTDREDLERGLRERIRLEFSPDVAITIRFVEAVPRSPSGKHKPVASIPWRERLQGEDP